MKIVMQDGYKVPFTGFDGRKKKKGGGKRKKGKNGFMAACGRKYRKRSPAWRARHKWTAFIKKHC